MDATYTLPGRRRSALLGLTLLLGGCGGLRLDDYADATPRFDPRVFFAGQVHAWGIVQDWRGRVVRRFDVDIAGRREGDGVVLVEDFVYADGERDERTWRIAPADGGGFTGRADDIIGTAAGETRGNAMRWRYEMDLVVDGRSWRVAFDDWMWQLDERQLFNRSYIRKFGFTVAEVSIFMQRVD